jgi:DNA-binding MarR family transcriptional regulator
MMVGVLTMSTLSGQLISRWGRYKVFPLIGTPVMALGLFLLSRMNAQSSLIQTSLSMLVLGLGLGMVMQVLVIAVQNAVDYRDLGVATSGATLFRLIGGSLGTAALGAVFAARLADNLSRLLPGGMSAGLRRPVGAGLDLQMLHQLPAATRAAYTQAFTASLGSVFAIATAVAVAGFLLALLIPERPLRETIAAAAGDAGREAGETFAMPTTTDDSAEQLLRGLAVLADRDVRRRYIERIVARAGVKLSPAAAWLLVRLGEDPTVDPVALGNAYAVPADRMCEALAELTEGGLLVAPTAAGSGASRRRELTPAGCETLERVVAARRARLAELFSEWAPERQEELARVLRRFANELVPEAPTPR